MAKRSKPAINPTDPDDQQPDLEETAGGEGDDETTPDDSDPGDEATPGATDEARPVTRARVSLLRNGPTVTQHDAAVLQVREDGTATLEVEIEGRTVVYDLPRGRAVGQAGSWVPA
jgi:hypothetical protein